MNLGPCSKVINKWHHGPKYCTIPTWHPGEPPRSLSPSFLPQRCTQKEEALRPQITPVTTRWALEHLTVCDTRADPRPLPTPQNLSNNHVARADCLGHSQQSSSRERPVPLPATPPSVCCPQLVPDPGNCLAWGPMRGPSWCQPGQRRVGPAIPSPPSTQPPPWPSPQAPCTPTYPGGRVPPALGHAAPSPGHPGHREKVETQQGDLGTRPSWTGASQGLGAPGAWAALGGPARRGWGGTLSCVSGPLRAARIPSRVPSCPAPGLAGSS